MAGSRKKGKSDRIERAEQSMQAALAEFEVDSRQACRALRVSIAVNVFGVGTLLPNELPAERIMAFSSRAM